MTWHRIIVGDVLDGLRSMDAGSCRCCVTSPPYWGLRDYGCDGQIGLEPTPEEFVARLVEVFREVRRVLSDDGTAWVNLGSTYANASGSGEQGTTGQRADRRHTQTKLITTSVSSFKGKDMVPIPWLVALALQADGWYLRSDIIWCLSGGTWLYVRSQKGDMPMMLRDAARLDPSTVQLWNGERWTQVLGWSKTARVSDELELVLRSGERISCTPTHQFPTSRGLLRAADIMVGDALQRVQLPEPDQIKRPAHIDLDAAWLAGLYIAEGSMSGDTIQIAGHATQTDRLERVQAIAAAYGGSATYTVDGNVQTIRVYGRLIVALLAELVTGRTAKDKGIAPACWRYGNDFLTAMLDGYLSGDGHYDEGNGRWRLGFTRNYNLERDLRTIAARLGAKLTLRATFVDGFGKRWPAFRGELRFATSGHGNEKDTAEVVAIRRSRCRNVYDVGVADEPHVFALASGILTHNSKPNPMPESVTDRPTKSHEYLFLLSKNAKYYYDAEAIAEPANAASAQRYAAGFNAFTGATTQTGERLHKGNDAAKSTVEWTGTRNARTVWTIATQAYPDAHFATFPEELPRRCIKAGSAEGDTVLDPFVGSGTTLAVARTLGRNGIGCELNPDYAAMAEDRIGRTVKPNTHVSQRADHAPLFGVAP